ncbi:MAG TPA: SseB family protein [Trebonia sp.]|nr:SseB family protein [Trebonia sp.]
MIPDGGTFVRPGVIAWDGLLAAAAGTARDPGYPPCELVEQAIARALDDEDAVDAMLAELARARLWLPLPAGPRPVTDGSAITVPVLTCAGVAFVPAFTSVDRLVGWADPRQRRRDHRDGPVRAGDPAWLHDLGASAPAGTRTCRHVVVPLRGLASRLPAGTGIAVNPGTALSVRLCPDAVGVFAGP